MDGDEKSIQGTLVQRIISKSQGNCAFVEKSTKIGRGIDNYVINNFRCGGN